MEHLNKIIRVYAKEGVTKGKLMTLNIKNNKKNETKDTINDWQRI